MTDDLNHRCRAAAHCVGRVPVIGDGETSYVGAITPGPDTLCNACIKRVQTQLEQLPHLNTALRSFLGTSMTAALGSKVNATHEHSTPINLRTLDLIDEIRDVTSRAGGPTIQVADLVGRPAEKFSMVRGGKLRDVYLDGVDRALAIATVWRKADGVVGLSRQWVRRATPCLRCGLQTLGMWSGESSVHCTNSSCAKTFTLDEYEKMCLIRADMEKGKIN